MVLEDGSRQKTKRFQISIQGSRNLRMLYKNDASANLWTLSKTNLFVVLSVAAADH